ncbi:MAG: aminotransferase class I/II-fold pyridoxal phosphate-dependent enzyme, partial [Gammaproteobacteria bacterium]
FAGRFRDGQKKKILLPMAPEYIGYADLGLTEDLFTARRPEIEYLAPHRFKYHVDFEHIDLSSDVGAICFSRPTNPTGNVLTDQEVTRLMALAQERQIPLIIDNAYGSPFPNIVFTAATPLWDEHTIVCLSLSKLGLPGARTGIVIAPEPVAQAITGMNAIFNLAPSSLGALLTLEWVKSGEIIRLSQEVVKPYYRGKAEQALGWLDIALEGLDYFVHHPEGAMFLWLWLRGLPIKSEQLYERLRRRGVVVVSGHYFFPGLEEDWRTRRECIRISYAQTPETVQQGIAIIGEEVRKAYREG